MTDNEAVHVGHGSLNVVDALLLISCSTSQYNLHEL